MRTRTVTERIGELLGPVDWSYDFLSHYAEGNDERRERDCANDLAMLQMLAANPDKFLATTDGGWPRVGWKQIIAVGMYDGWPYWRPVPSVCLAGMFGGQWHSFNCITEIQER